MDLVSYFIDFVLHIDKHLNEIVYTYQNWAYLIIFLIIFCETGLVITPFLPGDSLLFAAGAIAGLGKLNIEILPFVIFIAAFGGDNTNYWIGNFIGPKVFEKNYRLLRKDYLEKTHNFYEKHGGKTVIIARFIPIIRTFAPFVAGVGTMHYGRFVIFSLIGNILWISLFVGTGYFFGNIEWVQNHFSFIVIGIILISVMPIIIGYLKHRAKRDNQ